MAKSSKSAFWFPEQTKTLLLSFYCTLADSTFLRHLSVLTLLQVLELMLGHCTVLRFLANISVWLLSFRSKQFCLNKKAFLIDDICCIWRKRRFNVAGKTAWIVDANRSISFVCSRIKVCGLFNKFSHFETTFCISVLFKESSRVAKLIIRSKNSTSCNGVNINFFQFLANPRCCRREITVFRLMSISSKEWPINNMSSK